MSTLGAERSQTNPFAGATTQRAGWTTSPTLRRAMVDTAAIAALLASGVAGFGPVFGGSTGYVAAGLGVLLGLIIGVVGHLRGWSRLGSTVAVMLAYVALGGAVALPGTTIAGVIPTVTTVQRLTLLSFQSWRDLLTVSLPAGQYEGPAAMPYLLGLVCAVVAIRLGLRPRRYAWALLPAFALLSVGILWGARVEPLAGTGGLVFAAVALVWVAWRSQIGDTHQQAIFIDPLANRAPRRRQRVLALGATALAGLVGLGLVTLVGAGDRQVLRDDVTPPLDLRDYASPLTLFRDLETTKADEVLFTVTGLPAGARVRLAVMDGFNGNVYDVTDDTATFGRAGRAILPGAGLDASATAIPVTVQVGAYSGVWLPGGGDLRGISIAGADADTAAARREAGLYYNPATGTALTTAGVATGTTYTMQWVPPPTWTPEQVAALPSDATVGSVALAPVPQLEAVATAAASLAGDAATPMDQARAVATAMRTQGFYANGTADASLAGHTTGRISKLLDPASGQMVGDDEQYAVATTLVARQLGIPARVVMGFYPDPATAGAPGGALPIRGGDSHVWTEVFFDRIGWVPLDSTPDEDKRPDQQQPQPQERNDPQVLPPPEVPEEPEPLPPAKAKSNREEDREKKDNAAVVWLRWVGLGGGGLALAAAPFAAVVLAKSRRRRARRQAARPSDRVAGGWAEIIDVATDLGTTFPRHATRGEHAQQLAEAHGLTWAPRAAGAVDVLVFGHGEPTDEQVDQAWRELDEGRASLMSSLDRRQRWRARFGLASLRRPGDRPVPTPRRRVARLRLRGAAT